MARKIKVCFVTGDYSPDFIGGAGVYASNLALNISSKVDLTVTTEGRPRRIKFWKKKLKIGFTRYCFGNQLLIAFFNFMLFRQKYSKEYFEVLHAVELSALFFVFFKPKNVGLVTVTIHHTFHDMYDFSDSIIKRISYLPLIFIEKLIYEKSNSLIFNTKYEKDRVASYYDISRKKILISMPGVKMPFYSKKDRLLAREKLELKPDQRIVLYIGRLVPRKKVDVLVAALEMFEEKEKIKGIIIGQGKELKKLRLLSDRTSFLGFVEDTRPYLLASDVFVLPSEAEGGVSMAVNEAASYALPLVLSVSAANPKIFKEGKNGHIIRATSSHQTYKAIKKVLEKTDSMGNYSRKLAGKLSWEKHANEILSFYLTLAGK